LLTDSHHTAFISVPLPNSQSRVHFHVAPTSTFLFSHIRALVQVAGI
jgi:hypothetical protein